MVTLDGISKKLPLPISFAIKAGSQPTFSLYKTLCTFTAVHSYSNKNL